MIKAGQKGIKNIIYIFRYIIYLRLDTGVASHWIITGKGNQGRTVVKSKEKEMAAQNWQRALPLSHDCTHTNTQHRKSAVCRQRVTGWDDMMLRMT